MKISRVSLVKKKDGSVLYDYNGNAVTKHKEFIRCDSCNKEHPIDSQDFFLVNGNIYVGEKKGFLVGRTSGLSGVPESHYCLECFQDYIGSTVAKIRGRSEIDIFDGYKNPLESKFDAYLEMEEDIFKPKK